MTTFKKIRKVFISMFCVAILVCTGFLTLNFGGGGNFADALTSTTNSSTVLNVGNILTANYATSPLKVDRNVLDALYEAMTGKVGAELADVRDLYDTSGKAYFGSSIVQSATLNANAGGKDIVLTFGDLEWVITSVTATNDGKLVATFFLADGIEEAMGKWSLHAVASSNSYKYPSHMYSTSYVRNVLLNIAGCGYTATSSAASSGVLTGANEQDENNVFAKFTMDGITGSLTDFIITPRELKYLETQNHNVMSSYDTNLQTSMLPYTYTNCAWGVPEGAFKSTANTNYLPTPNSSNQSANKKEHYGDWADDYIWLPSIDDVYNIWRCNGNQISTKTSWSRHTAVGNTTQAAVIRNLGETITALDMINTYYVRPAMNIDLAALEDAAGYSIKTDSISLDYKGSAYEIKDIFAWYNDETKEYLDITCSGKLSNNLTDADTYTFTVTIKDNAPEELGLQFRGSTAKTATIQVTIEKAKLAMNTLVVDEFGQINISGYDSVSAYLNNYKNGTIYQRDIDNGTAPVFALQYKPVVGGSWTTSAPTNAGSYQVQVYITNDCNYVLSSTGLASFERPKDYVALPYFFNSTINPTTDVVGSTTTAYYGGANQIFTLKNSDTGLTGIKVGDRSTGLAYADTTGIFTVTNAGTYTVKLTLSDPDNTQWADKSTETERTVTLVVKPAKLTVTIDQEQMTSWSKGERGFEILIYVSGIINDEAVKMDVSYGVYGSTDVKYVPDTSMSTAIADDGTYTMTIKVDTTNLAVDTKYALNINLRDNVAVNKNYELINKVGEWDFLLTKSKIKAEDITEVWMYSNDLVKGDFADTTSGTVLYNGSEYTVGLNMTYLPAGVEVKYSANTTTGTNVLNSKHTITAILSPMTGYEFESDVPTSFTFTWEILPIEFDVSTLVWAAEYFEYNGKTQTMSILNLPTWLAADDYSDEYFGKNVDTYTATYTAASSAGNYKFVCSEDSNDITLVGEGQSAILTHTWEIKKAVIQVSNTSALWVVKQIQNTLDEPVDLREPTAMSTYGDQLILKYYTDKACANEIDPTTIEYDKDNGDLTGLKTYYAKVWLNEAFEENYELQNVTDSTLDHAILSFTIGGQRTVLHLTVDETLVFNGQAQQVSITSDDADYNSNINTYRVEYYTVDENGKYGTIPVTPNAVGKYVAVIYVSDEDEGTSETPTDKYIVYNHFHEFEIVPLQLTTNWPSSSTNLAVDTLPDPDVKATDPSANINANEFYTLTIYDSKGAPVDTTKDLKYGTKYTAKLTLKDTSGSVFFADSAVTEFTFTTITDGNAVVLDNPIIADNYVVYDGDEHLVVIQIKDANGNDVNIDAYVDITLKSRETLSSEDLKFTDAGVYTLVVTIKDDVSATWLWDGEIGREVVFTIDKKPIIVPSTITEYEWNENGVNIWTDDDSYLKWVDNDVLGTYFATEIGQYSAKFVLVDKENTYWDDRNLVLAGTETDDIEITWKITKVKISGSWINDKGYPEFVPDDKDKADLFDVKYVDADGNEVATEDFVEGEEYTAVVSLKEDYDTENYAFVVDEEEFDALEMDFTYHKPASVLEDAWQFIKDHWIWFVIGLGILLLLIILLIIILAVKRRKKKEEEVKPDEVKEEAKADEENKLEEDKKAQEQSEKEKQLEQEKDELKKQLDEAKAQGQANQSAQMNNGFAAGGMGQQGYNVPPQYQGFYYGQPQPIIYGQPQQNSNSDNSRNDLEKEIQELKEQVKELKKEKLARDDEKAQDQKLIKDEKKLIKYILDNFDNLPNWLPFNKQDLIDYPVEELVKLYKSAKQKSKNQINARADFNQNLQGRLGDYSNSKLHEDEKRLQKEAEEIERKVAEYRKMKEKMQYESRMQELKDRIAKVDSENKNLQKYQEEKRQEILDKLKKNKKD